MDIVERARVRNAPQGYLALIDDLADEIERLRAALRPFAARASAYDAEPNLMPDSCPVVADPAAREYQLTVGHLREARQVLSEQVSRENST